jgi:hypothetical protein
MVMFLRIVSLLFLFSTYPAFYSNAQSSLQELESELAYHADVMTNATLPKHRISAMKNFNQLFEKAIQSPNSFSYPFDSLVWISKKMPDDQSFKIYTWEVQAQKGDYKYFGWIQTKSGQVFKLNDDFKNAEGLADEEFTHENWLGSLYYNIMPGTNPKGQKYYLLFGLNRYSANENVKLIDVLFFSGEGVPYFGLPIFAKNESGAESNSYLNRLVFKYASEAHLSLNYNPGMEMIMVDNLVRKMSRVPGQSDIMVPDGSYIGYQSDKGIWKKVEKIATEVMDEAPRPKPVLDQRKNNTIHGDQKKVKNKK